MVGKTVLEGCEILCLTGDLITCPLPLADQKKCKMKKQYEAGIENGRQMERDEQERLRKELLRGFSPEEIQQILKEVEGG